MMFTVTLCCEMREDVYVNTMMRDCHSVSLTPWPSTLWEGIWCVYVNTLVYHTLRCVRMFTLTLWSINTVVSDHVRGKLTLWPVTLWYVTLQHAGHMPRVTGLIHSSANTRRPPNVDLLLVHRLRRWPNSTSTLAQRLACARIGSTQALHL